MQILDCRFIYVQCLIADSLKNDEKLICLTEKNLSE